MGRNGPISNPGPGDRPIGPGSPWRGESIKEFGAERERPANGPVEPDEIGGAYDRLYADQPRATRVRFRRFLGVVEGGYEGEWRW